MKDIKSMETGKGFTPDKINVELAREFGK